MYFSFIKTDQKIGLKAIYGNSSAQLPRYWEYVVLFFFQQKHQKYCYWERKTTFAPEHSPHLTAYVPLNAAV